MLKPLLLTLLCASSFVVVVLTTLASPSAAADRPTPQPLWPGSAPGALGNDPVDVPSITLYPAPADKANGAAVLICPGGGYGGLADHEGHPVAEWLNTFGVTAAVLKYRLGPRYHHPAPLNDAARGLRTLRSHAAEWKIRPDRIGILGFSAGGHLASSLSTHFDEGKKDAADPVDRVSSRPDFAVLIYPVISFTTEYAHLGSRNNLLGKDPPMELVALLSSEKQVTERTPPTFLIHTAGDKGVPCENSLLYAMALRRAKVPVELHVYEHGEHGFGLGGNDPVLSGWPAQCAAWMKGRGLLGG